jgi:hypothetical protein
MDLSGPVLPPWARYGLSSMTTRPFLSVHRSNYGVVPRLFPASLKPYRIALPIAQPKAVEIVGGNNAQSTTGGSVDRMHGPVKRHGDNSGRKSSHREGHVSALGLSNLSRGTFSFPTDLVATLAQDATQTPIRTGSPSLSSSSRSSSSESIGWRERNRLPDPVPANTACSVSVGDESSVIFAQAGRFSSVAVYGVSRSHSDDGDPNSLRIERLAVPVNPRYGARFRQDDLVRMIQATGTATEPSEPAFVAVGSVDRVHIATLQSRRRMTWMTDFPVNNLYSLAFSRICPEEIVTLSADGLRLKTVEVDCSVSYSAMCDIWPLKVEHRYFKVSYGSHPRTILVASDAGLHRVDLRTGYGGSSAVKGATELDASAEILTNVWTDWKMSSHDGGVRIFEAHPRNPFWSILATDHSLNVVDERMSRMPLLSWTLTSASQATNTISCVSGLPSSNDEHGDIIVLGNPKEGSISAFHMVSGRGSSFARLSRQVVDEHSSQKNTMRSSGTSSGPLYVAGISNRLKSLAGHSNLEARFPIPQLLWSDHPLSNLYAYAPTERLCGVALLPLSENSTTFGKAENSRNKKSYISLVQVSASGGAMAQLIGCGIIEDESIAFESVAQRIFTSKNKAIADSASALWDMQAAACEHGKTGKYSDLRQRSQIVRSTMIMHAHDAMDLRYRISSAKDDDVSEGENTSIARPYVRDRPLVTKLHATLQEGGSQTRGGDWTRIGSLQEFLSRPRTLSEVALFTRAGYPHSSTPVGLNALREMLESSPYVDSYEVSCPQLGLNEGSVTVYTSGEDAEAGDNEETAAIEGTPFASLLSDLRALYNKDTEDQMQQL